MSDEPRHRRSIRLKGRDYSWPGTYFITICTAAKKCLLGRLQDDAMQENHLGRLARSCWIEIPKHFANVELDAFVVMPNHIHGMLHLHRRVPADEPQYKLSQFGKPQAESIATIVATYKAAVTRAARQTLGRPRLLVWQSNYYERVVRDGKEYADVYRYIHNNPRNWAHDDENPVLMPASAKIMRV